LGQHVLLRHTNYNYLTSSCYQPPCCYFIGKGHSKLSNFLIIDPLSLLMPLQPSLGPGRFFQFINLIHSRYDSLDGGSARRKAATYTGQHKHRINAKTNIYALSGIRTHDPSVRVGEGISFLRPRGHCDNDGSAYIKYACIHSMLRALWQ
jgi:hypothetical protein